MKAKGSKILRNVRTHWINMLNPTKRVLSMYMPLVAKKVEDNPFLMGYLGEFRASLWCGFAHFPFLFDANARHYPWTNQICTKKGCFCWWLCCSSQDLPRTTMNSLFGSYNEVYIWCYQRVPWFGWLHSQHNASKMESKFLGPQHFGCWIFMFWF